MRQCIKPIEKYGFNHSGTCLSLLVFNAQVSDVVYRILDSNDFLGIFVRYFNLVGELLNSSSSDMINSTRSRISAQIINKAGCRDDIFFVNAQLFYHDFLDPL